MNRYRLTLAAAVCCALSLYFMDGETEQQRAAIAESNADGTTSSVETSQEKLATEVNAEEGTHDQVADQVAGNEKHQLAFEPPFPERTNLFQAPKRHGRGRSKSDGQSETAVELLGFVNVDVQRVALSIDGLVTMVAEGEKRNGIEVISIKPPAVFLQRGKQRWQASFEN